jgi:hypothetical protein
MRAESVGTCRKCGEPVESARFSTAAVHRANGHSAPDRSVFPVVHTPYDFYERT